MANCANCSSEAKYGYTPVAGFTLLYCDRHLPRFLHSQKAAGLLPVPFVEEPVVEEVVVPTKKVKKPAEVSTEDNAAN
jgi:hypothetical protein